MVHIPDHQRPIFTLSLHLRQRTLLPNYLIFVVSIDTNHCLFYFLEEELLDWPLDLIRTQSQPLYQQKKGLAPVPSPFKILFLQKPSGLFHLCRSQLLLLLQEKHHVAFVQRLHPDQHRLQRPQPLFLLKLEESPS